MTARILRQASLFDEPTPAEQTPESQPRFVKREPPKDHAEAMRAPRPGFEAAFVGMYRALADYADAHRERYGYRIMDDGYIGEAWYTLGHALVDLLNGEIGRLDGGTLDGQIRALIDGGGDALSTQAVRQETAPPPKRRGGKVRATGAEDIGKRRLTDRQRELVRNVAVEGNLAVYLPEEHIADWAELKSVMLALGGKWKTGGKKAKGGFVFPDDIDARETVRLALESGEILDPKAAEFFETSDELADALVRFVNPRPGDFVLEPSAGRGSLVRAVQRACPDVQIVCVEPFPDNRAELERQGLTVIAKDFLSVRPSELADEPSVIVMNPPFSKRSDVRHITHAMMHLRPGGRLAAIASAGVMYRDDAIGREFRELVKRNNGTIAENPPGSFAAAGTMVSTVTVQMVKR